MYRAVIEHPEWIPDDWEKRLDLRAGSEEGRIYRVYPVDKSRGRSRGSTGSTPRAWSPRSTAPAAGSATPLSGCSCTGAVPRHSRGSVTWCWTTSGRKARAQAIWTLADLGGLDEPTALAGLTDPESLVRESCDRRPSGP